MGPVARALMTVILGLLIPVLSAGTLRADTLYLGKGGKIFGIVQKETKEYIAIEVCGGIVTFDRNEVQRIERGPEEEGLKFRQMCLDEKERNLERIAIHASQSPVRPPHIPFRGERFAVILDANINNKAHASLLLDTGAALVVLKKSVADRMGLDLSTINTDLKLALTDGREVSAKYVMLNTVSVGDKVAYGVEAAIMMDDAAGPTWADGLLGMSFLNRFNFTIDYTTNSVILEEHYR